MNHRTERQEIVNRWCHESFGAEHATNLRTRGMRLLEEAIEAAQAAGVTQDSANDLVDYVFSRPVGDLNQEIGGVSLTLLVLCSAAGLDADLEEQRETDRVLAKAEEDPDFFRLRNDRKVALGFV